MPKIYSHLTTQERAVIMTMRDDLCSIRSIAKRLFRSASTISREIKRTSDADVYDANLAHLQCQARRVFLEDLDLLQENGWALFGLTTSLEALGLGAEAAEARERFDEAWEYATAELTRAHF